MIFYRIVGTARNHRKKEDSAIYDYWKRNNLIYKEKDNFVTVFNNERKNELFVVVFNK